MSNLPFSIYNDNVISVSNSSTAGLGLVNPPFTTTPTVKTLVAGANVNLTNDSDTITISASGAGGTVNLKFGEVSLPSNTSYYGLNGTVDVPTDTITLDSSCAGNISDTNVTLSSIIMTPLPTMSSFVNNIGTMCCGKYLAVKAAVAIREGEVVSFTGDDFEVTQCGTSDYLSTSMGVLGVSLNSAGVGETVYVCVSGFCTVYGSEVFGPNTGGSLIAMSSNPNIDGIAQYVNGLARTQNQLVGILIKAEAAPSGGGPTPPTGAVAKYLIWLNQGLMNTS